MASTRQLRTVNRLRARALGDLRDWSGVLRINRVGTAGPLDRVAQIAERKYCRPQARPFGLGFPRKVPMFPICPSAAL